MCYDNKSNFPLCSALLCLSPLSKGDATLTHYVVIPHHTITKPLILVSRQDDNPIYKCFFKEDVSFDRKQLTQCTLLLNQIPQHYKKNNSHRHSLEGKLRGKTFTVLQITKTKFQSNSNQIKIAKKTYYREKLSFPLISKFKSRNPDKQKL
jgi:hypothetical protein